MSSFTGSFNRPEIGAPITHPHKYCTADYVADGYREQVFPQTRNPAQRTRFKNRRSRNSRPLVQKYPGGNEIHIGYTVLKSDGNKTHNRKINSEYLADCLTSNKGHPDGQTYQPVTTDPANKGFDETKADLFKGNVNSSGPQRSGASFS